MRVTRFCSFDEYFKFSKGEMLVNARQHRQKNKSLSIGFCFCEDEPKTAFEYLKGIVDLDVCMVLDIEDKHLTESVGIYHKPGFSGNAMMVKREWCATWYNNRIAKLISVDSHFRKLAPSHRDIKHLLDNLNIYGTGNDRF